MRYLKLYKKYKVDKNVDYGKMFLICSI